jgi:polysaccharide export outer membrane protein
MGLEALGTTGEGYGSEDSICCTIDPMSRLRLVTLILFLCALGPSLVSAASKKDKKDVVPAVPGTAPSKTPGTPTVDPKSFVIGPEDILWVRVWNSPQVSGQVTVRPDGKITLQLLGEVQAAGQTPEALTQAIYDGVLKFEQHDKSEVTVEVRQVNSRKYFIQGEVGKAGSFPLLLPTTVLEALVNAGGFREFANSKRIIIMRAGKQYHFNYKEVIHGRKMEQNILLQPGDQIIVP